jgi:Na+/melibiose symporter-like transporter
MNTMPRLKAVLEFLGVIPAIVPFLPYNLLPRGLRLPANVQPLGSWIAVICSLLAVLVSYPLSKWLSRTKSVAIGAACVVLGCVSAAMFWFVSASLLEATDRNEAILLGLWCPIFVLLSTGFTMVLTRSSSPASVDVGPAAEQSRDGAPR